MLNNYIFDIIVDIVHLCFHPSLLSSSVTHCNNRNQDVIVPCECRKSTKYKLNNKKKSLRIFFLRFLKRLPTIW